MTNLTLVNNDQEFPVTCDSVTNWNGAEVDAYSLEPYSETVGNEILDEVEDIIREFVFATERDTGLLTTWIGHANKFTWFKYTPRLGFTAGVHECGKSQALEVCQLLTNNSYYLSDVTPASFFTYTQHGDKALFVDEMTDSLRGGEGSLTSALKTGTKANGSVPRVEMGTNGRRVVQFRTYAAVAFGGVRVDAVMDSQNRSRTHWVHMRRAMLGEDPETLDERIDGHRFKVVGGRYLKWLQQNEQAIKGFDKSQLPKHLIGRDRDKWLPLFAIASVAGNKWLDRIRRYALEELDDSNQLTDSTQILKAVQDIYFNWDRYSVKLRDTKVTTGNLCKLLAKWTDEDGRKPYAKWNNGVDLEDRIIRSKQLTGLLGSFINARGKSLSTEGHRSMFDGDRTRGYLWADLIDASDRHLPESYRLECHAVTCDKEVSHD